MNENIESQKVLIDYYLDAKESFLEKMKSEDDERSNLKFKIAALVIYELTNSTPDWFKHYFLSSIAKFDHRTDTIHENISNVESAFYDVVADYLIKMESEVEYVKKIIVPLTKEQEKKDFWKPIVFDAFLIAGIYFAPSLVSSLKYPNSVKGKQRKIHPRYLNPVATETGRL